MKVKKNGKRNTTKRTVKAVKKLKPKPQKKSTIKSKYPRAEANPFRIGSSYATAFDILAAHPTGLPRQELVEKLAAATAKSVEKAGFDAAVVLSAHNSPTGKRHRSCREGFWIERENDHVKLRTS